MPEQGQQVLQSRVVRRRNPRPINSCVECRTRKSRCSKTQPCQNCTAFGRECIFITVPESAARKKEREQRERAASKSGTGVTIPDWTKNLPVRTQSSASVIDSYENSNSVDTTTPGTPPRDYEWEAYQQDVEADGDAWERLPAEPEETQDDVYEDENDDEDQIATDLTIRIGRMIICENVTGFFRPQYAEEVLSTPKIVLVQHPWDSPRSKLNAAYSSVSSCLKDLALPFLSLGSELRNPADSYQLSKCHHWHLR
jgi:hypothetical protein